MAVYGFVVLFQSTFGIDATDASNQYSRKSLLVMFAIVFAFSFLGQWNIAKLRRRLRN